MTNILIIGAGSMGTAFSFPCSDNKHLTTIVGTHLEDDFIDLINSTKKHPALDCEIPPNVKFLKYQKLSEVINKAELIVVAVVSKGIEWVSNELSKTLKKNIPILILTKGLSVNGKNYEVLAHKMERLLKEKGVKETNISAAGGPCLAKGLANKVHTSVVFANSNIKVADKFSNLIATNYYHIFTSNDVIGVEISAAIKNIFSMAIGASEGLCHPNISEEIRKTNYLNTAASLLQQSLQEMIFFVENLKGKKETVLSLAGIGDLYVSAYGGRNSKMGYYIGQGMTYEEVKKSKMPNDTVEGVELIKEIGSKVKSDFTIKELPVMIGMINAILDKRELNIEWKNFI